MADQKRKAETIRSIESLQLAEGLIAALDSNVAEAESVAEAIRSAQSLSEQWY